MAYESSQAKGLIGAAAAGLCHSHGNTRAAPETYTTACSNVGSLTYCLGPGMEPASSWTLREPQWELLFSCILNSKPVCIKGVKSPLWSSKQKWSCLSIFRACAKPGRKIGGTVCAGARARTRGTTNSLQTHWSHGGIPEEGGEGWRLRVCRGRTAGSRRTNTSTTHSRFFAIMIYESADQRLSK